MIFHGTNSDDRILGDNNESDIIYGYDGDDHIYGGGQSSLQPGGNEHIYGGKGDDYLVGGGGADSYYYAKGDGQDVISNWQYNNGYKDGIIFLDVGMDELQFGRFGNALIIRFNHSRDGIIVKDHFAKDYNDPTAYIFDTELDYIAFGLGELAPTLTSNKYSGSMTDACNASYDIDEVIYGRDYDASHGQIEYLFGFGGNDKIYGNGGKDLINGGTGDDYLDGGDGDDELYGEDGNDIIYGGNGRDIITGGAGNDFLHGGEGRDDYIFHAGWGSDIIDNYDSEYADWSGQDQIIFKNIKSEQIAVSKDGNDLILLDKLDNSNQIRVLNYFLNDGKSNYFVNSIVFSDKSWGYKQVIDQLKAINRSPEVNLQLENQQGKQGNLFSLTLPDNLFIDPDGDQLNYTITLANGSALPGWLTFDVTTLTLKGIPDNADIGNLNLKISVTDLFGNSASQYFSLEIENINDSPIAIGHIDTQQSVLGEFFTFTFAEGLFTDPDGDTLTYSITLADGSAFPSWLHYDPNTRTLSGTPTNGDLGNLNLIITATDTGGLTATHTLQLEVLAEAKYNEIIGTPNPDNNLKGTSERDRIKGLAGNDTLYGYAGDDVLYGDEGNDRLYGGDDNDSLYGGDGNDYLYGENGNDKLYGGEGNDTLDGAAGDDWLEGGAGNDTLNGGLGSDTYYFERGWGIDSVNNYVNHAADDKDVIRFGAGISAGDIIATRSGSHMILSLKDGTDKITVSNHFYQDGDSNYAIHGVEFADGTSWSQEQLKQLVSQSRSAPLTMTAISRNHSVDALVSAMGSFNPPAAAASQAIPMQQNIAFTSVLAAS